MGGTSKHLAPPPGAATLRFDSEYLIDSPKHAECTGKLPFQMLPPPFMVSTFYNNEIKQLSICF